MPSVAPRITTSRRTCWEEPSRTSSSKTRPLPITAQRCKSSHPIRRPGTTWGSHCSRRAGWTKPFTPARRRCVWIPVLRTRATISPWRSSQAGRSDEAAQQFSEAVQLDPGNANTHYNLGNLYMNTGSLDEALAQYSEALRLNPGFAEAHSSIAIILLSGGKVPDAISHYAAALQLQPDNLQAMNALAWIYATSADAGFRNDAGAVRLAEQAYKITGSQQRSRRSTSSQPPTQTPEDFPTPSKPPPRPSLWPTPPARSSSASSSSQGSPSTTPTAPTAPRSSPVPHGRKRRTELNNKRSQQHSHFVIPASCFFRHWSFVIRHFPPPTPAQGSIWTGFKADETIHYSK